MPPPPHEPAHLTAFKAATIYLAIALLWLLFTEQLLNAIVDAAVKLSLAQIFKSIAFMVMTSGLLYWLVWRSLLTERMIQLNLRYSQARAEALFQGSTDLVFVFPREPGQPFSEVNDHACKHLGLSREALCARTVEEFFSAQIASMLRALEPGDECMMECPLQSQHEHPLPVEIHARCIQLGKQNLVIASARDLSARKTAESALQESERRYRLLAENATDVIWTLEQDNTLSYVSPSAERVLGTGPNEHRADSPHFLEPVLTQALQRMWHKESDHEQHALAFLHPDGSQRWLEVYLSHLLDSSGVIQGILGVSRDITARRRAEDKERSALQQLHQAQKMEAVGTLAGGVAHDLNNFLAVIIGNADMAAMDQTMSKKRIQQIQMAAERASALVQKLLLFSRQQPAMPKPADLNTIILALKDMVCQLLGPQIQLDLQLSSEPHMARVDRNQLEQVLLNLSVNARDAMPSGGVLRIETDTLNLLEQDLLAPGCYIRIRVSDNGTGMDEATQGRIFEPFFTTKEVGKGTGLGLSTAYGILQDHKGDIKVSSTLGVGTTFTLLLPTTTPITFSARVAPTTTVLKPPPLNLLHVLVVEDERLVQTMIAEALEQQGCTVTLMSSVQKAQKALQGPHDYNILISDVVLPDGVGYSLVKNTIPTLMISAYAPEDLRQRYAEFIPEAPLLRKPFSLKRLTDALRHLLEAAQERESG